MLISKIEKAGLGPEVLSRASAGQSAATVHAWLESRGIRVALSTLKTWVCNRTRNGKWSGAAKGTAPTSMVIAPVVEVINRLPEGGGIIDEIRELALARVRCGEATVADARILEVALKAAVARTLTGGDEVEG